MAKRIWVAILGILLGGLVGFVITMLTGRILPAAVAIIGGGIVAVVWAENRETTLAVVQFFQYLVACLIVYLLCWFVAYSYVMYYYGRVDYSYLFDWFRATWFNTGNVGETPAMIWWYSCMLFVLALFPTFVVIRRLVKLWGTRRSNTA